MVSKWIANLDSTIILWKSIFLLKNLYGCIFALSRQIKRKKHFILGFHKNIKSLVPIFMKNCMSQSLTRKQRVRKICIWICQNDKVLEKSVRRSHRWGIVRAFFEALNWPNKSRELLINVVATFFLKISKETDPFYVL